MKLPDNQIIHITEKELKEKETDNFYLGLICGVLGVFAGMLISIFLKTTISIIF